MRAEKRISVSKFPAVRCSYSRLVPSNDLHPNPRNPNRHPPEQLRLYAKILRHQGWRKPITVSKRSGLIVTGEGAWRTAIQEGWPMVPVDLQQFSSTADEYAHLLADNKLPQMADPDDKAMALILSQDLHGVDLELAGVLLEDGQAAEAPAQFPIVAKVLEHHDFVLVFCDNEMDWQYLQQLCGVRKEASYKKRQVGAGRAVPFARFLESLYANRNSLDGPAQSRQHDRAGPKRAGLRAQKPG